MSSSPLHLALWILQPLLQAVIAVIMFHRRLHKTFPAFFAYLPTQVIIFCVGYPAYRYSSSKVYFCIFCIFTLVDLVFNFKILHEILLDIFRPYDALKDLGNALFKWGALVMILVSIVLISAAPGWGDPLNRTLLVVHRSVRMVQCGMLIFLLAFCKYLGVTWKRPSFGLALGFGILAISEMTTYALHSGQHLSVQISNVTNMIAWDASLVIWLAYFVSSQRTNPIPILIPQRWDEALTEIRPAADSESLIPMFENMVDRALSRAQDAHG